MQHLLEAYVRSPKLCICAVDLDVWSHPVQGIEDSFPAMVPSIRGLTRGSHVQETAGLD